MISEVAMIVSTVDLKEEYLNLIKNSTGEDVTVCARPGEQAGKLAEAEIIISFGDFNAEDLELCKNLKWLFVTSAGVEKLPFEKLAEKSVCVTNASGIHTTQMAEQIFGMMIAFSRRLADYLRYQQRGIWHPMLPFGELKDKTLCIVGAGSIARETARKAKAFDMKVIGLKRHASPLPDFDSVWDMSRFHEALGLSDYVVVLTPLTDETFYLFGAEEFSLMRTNAVIINMSRGDTIDEKALIEALRSGKIAGAGLDVFHNEPLEPESPLWGMENVIITPHTAGGTPDYIDRALDLFLKSYKCLRSGGQLPNIVDLKLKY
jgi:D-2-hydroxyacid dehydrogenase (NADP+)